MENPHIAESENVLLKAESDSKSAAKLKLESATDPGFERVLAVPHALSEKCVGFERGWPDIVREEPTVLRIETMYLRRKVLDSTALR